MTKRKTNPKVSPAGKPLRSNGTKSKARSVAGKPALLAGGNPQIAKADGNAPVQAYIAAIPGWKREVVAQPRRADSTHYPQSDQGREVELTLLWHRRPGLVSQLPLFHELR